MTFMVLFVSELESYGRMFQDQVRKIECIWMNATSYVCFLVKECRAYMHFRVYTFSLSLLYLYVHSFSLGLCQLFLLLMEMALNFSFVWCCCGKSYVILLCFRERIHSVEKHGVKDVPVPDKVGSHPTVCQKTCFTCVHSKMVTHNRVLDHTFWYLLEIISLVLMMDN